MPESRGWQDRVGEGQEDGEETTTGNRRDIDPFMWWEGFPPHYSSSREENRPNKCMVSLVIVGTKPRASDVLGKGSPSELPSAHKISKFRA